MKKIVVVTLFVALLLGVLLLATFSVGAATSGYYTYYVSGNEATITDVDTYIKGDITVPSTLGGYPVKHIKSYAFYNCDEITGITLPESVVSIGEDAFYYCDSLEAVNITNVAAWANIQFENMYANPLYIAKNLYINNVLVTDITIPDGVENISSYAFYNCHNLESITIPDSVTNIGSGAFSGCINLSKVNITDVAAWSNIQFENSSSNPLYVAKNLYVNDVLATDMVIPDSVTGISDYAFYNCTSLETIRIPNSVTRIGFSAFSGCNALESITLPFVGESLNGTSNTHFAYIFGKSSYVYDDVVPASLKHVIVTDATTIDTSAFSGCANITDISLPKTVVSIGDRAFNCASLTTIAVDAENEAFVSVDGVLFNSEKTELICYPLGKGKSETSYDVPNSVTRIAPYTFSGCTALVEITIPDSVTSIGEYAFSGCKSLKKMTIPDSVTSIGEYAFNECKSLKEMTIPDSVISIGDRAFFLCSDLETIAVGTGLKTIGEYAFASCEALTGFYMTNSVTSIGRYAFYDCESLKAVTLSDSMTSISASTFWGCSSLESITIPDSVTSIQPRAFSSCTSLTSVVVPDTVTGIGSGAFAYCNALESIVLPFVGDSLDGTTNTCFGYIFGADSYSENDTAVPASLKTVVITKAIKIAKNAFRSCVNLESITIPKTVTGIGTDAFYGCTALSSVTVDAQNQSFSSVDGVLFDKQKTKLIYYPLGKENI
ncbi:MAG: leucine-rich repeat domain-containing protein, partial [Clostridia bacterium]|nr:leucine-rich repeat domain-containing protein [Clostridia bacterium]